MNTIEGQAVVIAGGSGFIGRSLARDLVAGGARVTVLTRSGEREHDSVRFVGWDPARVEEWGRELEGAAGLVNLCGRTVDCVKTPERCDEILRSRVEPTRALGEALRACADPPRVWVQMSTAHIYGDPPSARCDESAATGYGLAPTVGRAWERAFENARPESTRGVILRTSFVIGREGGALSRLRTLARWGLGGTVGRGHQGMSWIHERDMNRVFLRALADEAMRGVYNVSSPNPVSNKRFMRSLRRSLGVPVGLPAPAWLVRIGAPLVMRTDPELALYGRYIVPRRLLDEGFEFEHPELDGALDDLVRSERAVS